MKEENQKALASSFIELAIAMHRNFFRKVKLPLPINQFSVLGVLNDDGTVPMREVGDTLAMPKQQLTSIVDKLVRMGLVEKKENEQDRRQIDISLTPKGTELIASFEEKLREHIKSSFASLSKEDTDRIMSSVKTILKAIDRIEKTK
ncbi:MAG: winged helix DNA-binding protein [Schwartzia sp.]|nr:winged helix DNA-binding protein [Schwartzia sp. (in: firmicutes)]